MGTNTFSFGSLYSQYSRHGLLADLSLPARSTNESFPMCMVATVPGALSRLSTTTCEADRGRQRWRILAGIGRHCYGAPISRTRPLHAQKQPPRNAISTCRTIHDSNVVHFYCGLRKCRVSEWHQLPFENERPRNLGKYSPDTWP